MLFFHSPIVTAPDAFIFHASEAFSDPRIQFVKLMDGLGERRAEVIHRSAYHSVEFLNDLGVKVVESLCQIPDLRFEFLLGFWTHFG